MQQRHLTSQFKVSAMGLGCMGMSEFYGARDDKESMQVLQRAVEHGVTFFDTADIYGPHHNEQLLARFLSSQEKKLTIATKFGIVRKPGEYARTIDNSAQYAQAACDASLKRLGVEHIDLYYVHRVNPDKPIEEVMQALSALVKQGKIGHIGLCEVSEETLRRAHSVHPVTALQTEYSLWTRDVEHSILPACKELGVGFVPYSPLGRGFLTGTYSSDVQFEEGDFRAGLPRFSEANIKTNLAIVDALKRFATILDCTPAQLAIAWLLSKGENIVPIPGTRRLKYLEENLAAAELELTAADVAAIEEAIEPLQVAGERYTDEGMKGLNA